MRMRHAPANDRGFTLVEVLVALLLMAVVSAMAWQGLDAMMRTRDVTRDVMDRTLKLSRAIGQLEHDVMAFHSTSPGGQGARVVSSPFAFDGTALRLVRRTDEGLHIVVWALRDGVLQRWAGPPVTLERALQDQWFASLQLIGNETGHVRMLEGVASMQAYTHNGSGTNWNNAQADLGASLSNANAQAPLVQGAPRSTLPKGLRVVLTLQDRAGADGQANTITRDLMLGPQEF
jgi:general secretion pathway protein J